MTTASYEPSKVQIGDWVLEAELNQLTGPGGEDVHLEPRTIAVLGSLAAAGGRVCTRDELLAAVWGDAFVGEAALTHCIWELRKAFGDDAKNPSYIQTVPRRGYRLLAAVSAITPETPTDKVVVGVLVACTGHVMLPSTAPDEPDVEASPVGRSIDALVTTCDGERVVEAAAFETKDGTDDEHNASGATPHERGLVFAYFERPARAVRFALAWQDEVARDVGAADSSLSAHVGIHLGEIQMGQALGEGPRTVAGPVVSVAADLCAAAGERQTLVTRAVFDLARAADEPVAPNDARLGWLAHGDFVLADDDTAIEVFEVGVEGFAPLVAPAETASVRPVGVERSVLGWRPAPGLTIPQRPHWVLTRKLGEGGFGEVWLTEHTKTGDHRVFKFCVELDRLRALQREVTLFRLLKETLGWRRDITRILDWNFDQAPFFLELEYIEGGSYADWAEAQGGLENVPLPQRLEIVAQIGEALAAAHSIGVLHKDVKPGNILIGRGHDGTPRVRLTDFGIGQLADPSSLADAGITALGWTQSPTTETHSSERGTRLYLAPELLEGKTASIQSDIYSLGVVLYQSVVGRFDTALGSGWQRRVDDPLLCEEIARCVDVAPKRRPMSALDMAERLRSLEDRRAKIAAEARARDDAERDRQALAKAHRRRKLLTMVAVAAMATTMVVVVLTVLAIDARKKAEASQDRAERLVSFMLGDLRETLAGVGRLDAMEGTAENVLAYYASLDAEAMDDEALVRRANALHQIGEVRLRTGALDQAATAFTEAAQLADRLLARDGTNGSWRASRADSLYWLGDVRRRQGDLVGAREAFATHRALYGALVESDPRHRDWRLELAYGHSNLGTVLAELGDTEAALGHMRERLSVVNRLAADYPDDNAIRLALASSHYNLGASLQRRGELTAALEQYQANHAILVALAAAQPNDTRPQDRLATAAGYVGLIHWLRGDAAAARPWYAQEAAGFERLATLDPENTGWRRNGAIARSKIGRALLAMGDVADALDHFEGARSTFEQLVALDPSQTRWRRDLALRRALVAEALAAQGATRGALAEAQQAQTLLRAILDARPEDRAAARGLSSVEALRGELLEVVGERERARQAWAAALRAIESLVEGADEFRSLDPWARALIGVGRDEEAQPILDRLRQRGYRAPDFMAFLARHGLDVG